LTAIDGGVALTAGASIKAACSKAMSSPRNPDQRRSVLSKAADMPRM